MRDGVTVAKNSLMPPQTLDMMDSGLANGDAPQPRWGASRYHRV